LGQEDQKSRTVFTGFIQDRQTDG